MHAVCDVHSGLRVRVTLRLFVCFSWSAESSEHEDKSTDASGEVAVEGSIQAPASSEPATEGEEAPKSPSKSPSKAPDVDEEELGPLPDNWEMAYTEKGEVYFIEYGINLFRLIIQNVVLITTLKYKTSSEAAVL